MKDTDSNKPDEISDKAVASFGMLIAALATKLPEPVPEDDETDPGFYPQLL